MSFIHKPKTRNRDKQTVIYRDLDEEGENQSYDSEVSDGAEDVVTTKHYGRIDLQS